MILHFNHIKRALVGGCKMEIQAKSRPLLQKHFVMPIDKQRRERREDVLIIIMKNLYCATKYRCKLSNHETRSETIVSSAYS